MSSRDGVEGQAASTETIVDRTIRNRVGYIDKSAASHACTAGVDHYIAALKRGARLHGEILWGQRDVRRGPDARQIYAVYAVVEDIAGRIVGVGRAARQAGFEGDRADSISGAWYPVTQIDRRGLRAVIERIDRQRTRSLQARRHISIL